MMLKRMQNTGLALIAWAMLTTGCTGNAPADADLPPVDSLFAEYYEATLALYPMQATSEGDDRYDHLYFNNLTQAYKDRQRKHYRHFLDELERYDPASLAEDDRVSYDILKWDCTIALESLQFPWERLPMDQTSSVPLLFAQLASGESLQPFETPEDHLEWFQRVDSFVVWCDTAIAQMRLGIATGYVLPAPLIERLIPQMESLSEGPPEEHLYFSPAAALPADWSDSIRTALTDTYTALIGEKVIPAYGKITAFLTDEYLPAGRSTDGIGALPGGREWYDHLIRYYTTTTMSADSIFALGKSEVARIRKEMETVKDTLGFEGSLTDFFAYMRSNEDLTPYTDPQQVIDYFHEIHERMKPQLSLLFDKVPASDFEIRRTEPYREASASWEYQQPSKDGSRPGIFYVPIPDVRKYNMYADDNTFLHEAIPGHHYQIALQQENDSLPAFRQTLWYSAYGEGWALYTESLGKELGLYVDPIQYFGGLSWDMHRAIRLVVDVGIHVKGWTREEAIQYSLENEAEPEHTIISEIERYMATPGQALSYKIGQLKIMELKQRAMTELGDDFDIREFHNQVLAPGCVPLSTLESVIDRWIAGVRR